MVCLCFAVQNPNSGVVTQWTVVDKSNNMTSYSSNDTIVMDQAADAKFSSDSAISDDGIPLKRLRRVACTCPNCKDASKK